MAHTPGPWEVNATKVSCTVVRGSQSIATVNHFNWDYAENARLIARSPELFDLVEGLCLFPDVKAHVAAKFPGLIKQAEALVAEIKGGA